MRGPGAMCGEQPLSQDFPIGGEIVVRQSDDLPTYWEILTERLLTTHGTRPAHAIEELQLLHSRFPNHIKLFAAYQEGTMLAGVVIYESYNVAHAQYIA